ncbi:pantothenate permease [Clostridiales bacterium PH28_bin88]|nr:pantothenate permease [Clostridiales bacterium PH28_bin88]
MSASAVYAAMAIYIVIGTVVAYMSKQGMGKGMTEYFLGNRTMGGFVSALTYSATTYSAFMMVGLAGLTYSGGVGALGFELIYLCGLVLVAYFGPRFWLAGKKYDYVTPTELLGHRYDSKGVALLTALASCIFLIPYSAVQLMGIGYLMEGLSGGAITFMTGLIIATLLAIFWAWIAGLRSVAWTDSLQALMMMVAAVTVLLVVVYKGLGGFGGLFAAVQKDYAASLVVTPDKGFFKFSTFLGLSLPWFFFCISNPQVSQRLYTPKSLKHMRTMVIGFLIFGLIYTLVSVLWGFSAKVLVPNLPKADLATPSLLALPIVPKLLALIVMVGIAAAAISTVDSIFLTLSSMVSRDIYKNLVPNASEDSQLMVSKAFIPIIAIAAFLFARLKLGLIAVLSTAASAGLLVMVPAIFGAFFWKKGTSAGAIASTLIAGGLSLYLQYTNLKPLGWWPGVWAFIVSIILFVGVSLVTQPPTQRAEEFIGYLDQSLKQHNAI